MKYVICSVYDCLAGFGQPFGEQNKAVASRAFSNGIIQQIESDRSVVSPSDLSLFCFGEFDTETGELFIFDTKEKLVDGASVEVSYKAKRGE